MTAQKALELQIPITAEDQTAAAFRAVSNRLDGLDNSAASAFGAIGKASGVAAAGISAIGIAAATATAATISAGQETITELEQSAAQLGETLGGMQELYLDLQSVNPASDIENISEALKTLQEGFFDARDDSGALNDIIEFFGADINLDLDRPTDQLLEFLKVVRKLPTETDRVGAAISNLGGDDAKMFIPIVRDVEKLDDAISALQKTSSEVPGVFSDEDIVFLGAYRNEVNEFRVAFERFSVDLAARSAEARASFIDQFATPAIQWAHALTNVLSDDLSAAFEKISQLPTMMADRFGDSFGRIIQAASSFGDGLADAVDLSPWRQLFDRMFGETAVDAAKQGARDAVSAMSDVATVSTPLTYIASRSDRVGEELADIQGSQADAEVPALDVADKIVERRAEILDLAGDEVALPFVSETFDAESVAEKIAEQREQVTSLLQRGADDIETVPETDLDLYYGARGDMYYSMQEAIANIDAAPAERELSKVTSAFSSVSSAVNSFADLAASSGSKAADEYQKFGIVMATVATWSGAAQTLADPRLGFWEKLGAFAQVVSTGFGAVSSIRSLSSSSSSGASSGTTSVDQALTSAQDQLSSTQQTQQRETTINVSIQGDGMYSASNVEQLISAINDNDSGLRINASRVATT